MTIDCHKEVAYRQVFIDTSQLKMNFVSLF